MRRIIEVTAAIYLLIFLSPIMLVIGLLILITMGRPIFFTQIRPGLNAKPFKIIKFRTMTLSSKAEIELVGDESRSTLLGRWLRKFSLDEWPQLFNIINARIK